MYELRCTTCDLTGAAAARDLDEAISLAEIHNTMLHGGGAVATVHDVPPEPISVQIDAA
jgi:hypothetical protein